MMTAFGVSHDFSEEDLVAKARWFKGLTVDERLNFFESMMDFVNSVNPKVGRDKHDQPVPGRVRVVELP